jgi:hypothetical protein
VIYILSVPLNKEKCFLECRLSVFMCAPLAPTRLDGFYSYSTFYRLSVNGRCTINMIILDSETEAIDMGS